MRFLPAILANLALLLSAGGYGSLVRKLIPPSFRQVDRFAVILLTGTGLIGTLLFCVGQLWFSRWAILLILLGGIILGLKYLSLEIRQLRGAAFEKTQAIVPAAVIVAVLAVTAVAGLAEPSGDTRMDAIAYHLLGPKVWVRDTVIRPVPDEGPTAFPAIVETQFGALMSLGGQRAPEFFSVIALLLLLPITASLALRLGLEFPSALWAVALVVTMPVVHRGAYGGFIDVIYSGLVLAAARIAFDATRPGHYLLFGMLCGLAMGTKYFGLIAGPLLIFCVIVKAAGGKEQPTRTLVRNLAIAGAVALLVASPWYVRNWVALGSPIYPPTVSLSHFFHPKYFSPEAVRNFNDFFAKLNASIDRSPRGFLLLPFRLTFHPANFINGPGGVGLAPLALAPFGLWVCRRDSFARGLALFSLLQVAVWYFIGPDPRFVIHVFVIAAALAVIGWNYVRQEAPKFGPALASLVMACSILYGFFMIVSFRVDDLHAVVSSAFAEKRKHEEVPFLESFEFLNREPSVKKILVLEPRMPVYYLDRDYLRPVGRFGEESLPEGNNLKMLLSELSNLHISHVVDVKLDGKTFRLPDQPQGLSLVVQLEDQRIYAVN